MKTDIELPVIGVANVVITQVKQQVFSYLHFLYCTEKTH